LGQEAVWFHQNELGGFGDALPKQKGVSGSVENYDSIARKTVLDQIRADKEIAPVPRCQELHTRLLRSRSHPQHLPIKAVVPADTVRIV